MQVTCLMTADHDDELELERRMSGRNAVRDRWREVNEWNGRRMET